MYRIPKFSFFNPLASFDLNLLEKGWAKYFKNGLKSFHISHLSLCTKDLFWVRTLVQMSSPDRGVITKKSEKYPHRDVFVLYPLHFDEIFLNFYE